MDRYAIGIPGSNRMVSARGVQSWAPFTRDEKRGVALFFYQGNRTGELVGLEFTKTDKRRERRVQDIMEFLRVGGESVDFGVYGLDCVVVSDPYSRYNQRSRLVGSFTVDGVSSLTLEAFLERVRTGIQRVVGDTEKR